MSNRAKIVAIVLWSLVAVALIAVLVLYFTTDLFSSLSWKREPHIVYETTLEGDTVRSVEVKWRAGEVRIVPSEEGSVSVRQTSGYDVKPLLLSHEDGRLVLEEQQSFGFYFFGFGTQPSTLELRLPQQVYDRLLVQISSGDAAVEGVQAQEIGLRMTSGDMEVSALTAGTLSIDMTSGDLTASGCTADTLQVESTSGDFEIAGGRFAHITASSTSGTAYIESLTVPDRFEGKLTSGKMVLTVPENDGFSLLWEKSSGDVRTAGFGLEDYTDSRKGKVNYGTNVEREYRVEMTSGTFELKKGA